MELTIGTYKTTKALPPGDYLLLQRKMGGQIEVVFGPADDMKARYVAQVTDTARVLDGVELGVLPNSGALEIGLEGVAVMDERGRPWALTGDVEDSTSLPTAQALLASERFRDAVTLVRTNEIERVGQQQEQSTPTGIVLAQLRKREGQATDADVALVDTWMDRHWTEAA